MSFSFGKLLFNINEQLDLSGTPCRLFREGARQMILKAGRVRRDTLHRPGNDRLQFRFGIARSQRPEADIIFVSGHPHCRIFRTFYPVTGSTHLCEDLFKVLRFFIKNAVNITADLCTP